MSPVEARPAEHEAVQGRLDITPVDAENWHVNGPLWIVGRNQRWEIERGFITDLASVPRVATPYVPRYGIYTLAAVAHDLLCRIAAGLILACRTPRQTDPKTGRCRVCGLLPWISRRDADGMFRRVLRTQGVSFPKRWCMWAAVRAASGVSDGDAREWLTVLLIGLLVVPFLAVPVLLTLLLLGMTWLVEQFFRLVGLE